MWLHPEPDFVGYEVGPQYISDMREIELKEEHKQLKKYADDLSFYRCGSRKYHAGRRNSRNVIC